jgi:hypothetical protein
MENDNLELCFDVRGNCYVIPIAIINDPINFSNDYCMEKLKLKEKTVETQDIRVILDV